MLDVIDVRAFFQHTRQVWRVVSDYHLGRKADQLIVVIDQRLDPFDRSVGVAQCEFGTCDVVLKHALMAGRETFDYGREICHQMHRAAPVMLAGQKAHPLHADAKAFLGSKIVGRDQSVHLVEP